MSLLLRLLHLHLPSPSPSLHLTTPFASSIQRLLSTTPEAPTPTPQFSAVDYLTQNLGFSSDAAIRASSSIQHYKSTHKPDAVLRFLRQAGVSESSIRTAVSRDPGILCSSVEKNLRPNLAKLREIGLSVEDVSGLISRRPGLLKFNIVTKVDFWVETLGSALFVSVIMRSDLAVLGCSLEKVVMPNLAFLREKFGFSSLQIARLMRQAPRLMQSNPEALKITAKRAEALGADCSPGTFMYALIVVSNLNQSVIDARVNYLVNLGLSRENVNSMIAQAPLVLKMREELIGSKMQFLIGEAGCDKLHIVRNPALFTFSLEKRLKPRNIVRKLFMSKGIPVANNKVGSFMSPGEKNFVKKFVLPYEDAIPGLRQTYLDACAGKTVAVEWLENDFR